MYSLKNNARLYALSCLLAGIFFWCGTLAPVRAQGSPILSVAPLDVVEGNTGVTNAVVAVNLSASSSQTVTVSYRLVAMNATPDVDYSAVTGNLTFTPGQVARTLTVPILGDTEPEADERFFVQLFNAVNAGVSVSSNPPSVSIIDDDRPSLSLTDISLTEGNTGTTTGQITLTLSSAATQAITVNCSTQNGTAVSQNGDYQNFSSRPLTFQPGESSKTLSVTINGDYLPEADETFFVDLQIPTGSDGVATNSDVRAQVTISNDDAAGSNSVHLVSSFYEESEGNNRRFISLRRMGDFSGAARVDYTTLDETATQRTDYTIQAGTISFAPGEFSKDVVVLVSDDNRPETDETLRFVLSNPVGTNIASALSNPGPGSVTDGTAIIKILDNDTVTPTSNPLAGSEFFVRQHYADFLSREADSSGLNYWSFQISQCQSDMACLLNRRVGVSAAFFIEQEFQESGAYVYRLYQAAFGGTQANYRPAYTDFMPDRARVVGGASLAQGKLDYANLFASRPNFLALYPASLTSEQFVDALLQSVQQTTGLSFTPSERAAFINEANANGRGAFLRSLGDNAAFMQAVYNRAFVLMQYFGYLRRDPDQAGYDFWLNIVTNVQPNNYRGMVCAFITAAEYQERFSPVTPWNNNDCNQLR